MCSSQVVFIGFKSITMLCLDLCVSPSSEAYCLCQERCVRGLLRKGALGTGSRRPQEPSWSWEATETPRHSVSPLPNVVTVLYPAVCPTWIPKFSFHMFYLRDSCITFLFQTMAFLRVKGVPVLITVGQYVQTGAVQARLSSRLDQKFLPGRSLIYQSPSAYSLVHGGAQ